MPDHVDERHVEAMIALGLNGDLAHVVVTPTERNLELCLDLARPGLIFLEEGEDRSIWATRTRLGSRVLSLVLHPGGGVFSRG